MSFSKAFGAFANQKDFKDTISWYKQKDTIVDKCNIYLIKGTVLIDTGSGANMSNPQTLGENISHVFLTHWHWDHSGGAHFFDDTATIHIHNEDKESLMRGRIEDETLQSYFNDERYQFRAPKQVENVVSLDLGNRATLTPHHTPGHTRGSCVYHYKDEKTSCLFSGDTFYKGTSPFFNESMRADWIASLDFIKKLCEEEKVTIVFGGHGSPLQGEDINRQIAHQKSILQTKRTKMGMCLNCFRTLIAHEIKTCSGCMRVTYCGEACAENHWINHYQKCK